MHGRNCLHGSLLPCQDLKQGWGVVRKGHIEPLSAFALGGKILPQEFVPIREESADTSMITDHADMGIIACLHIHSRRMGRIESLLLDPDPFDNFHEAGMGQKGIVLAFRDMDA